jgi:hypothetical protein
MLSALFGQVRMTGEIGRGEVGMLPAGLVGCGRLPERSTSGGGLPGQKQRYEFRRKTLFEIVERRGQRTLVALGKDGVGAV